MVNRNAPTRQVRAAWRWANFLTEEAKRDGKVPLLVNLDETSVPFGAANTKGNMILAMPRRQTEPTERPTMNISRKTTRAHFTHVAVICDDPTMQPLLPQVLIFNDKQITTRRAAALENDLPFNVRIIVKKSAWTDASVNAAILASIGKLLESFPTKRAIVILDTCNAHLDAAAWARAWGAGIWTCLVPPSLTWLLQPLDTHCFARYKAELGIIAADRFRDLDRDPTAEDIAIAVGTVIRKVLQGTVWRRAFQETGWSHQQRHISNTVAKQIHFKPDDGNVGSTIPSDADLTATLPRGRRLARSMLLAPWTAMPTRPPDSPVTRADAADTDPGPDGAVADRRVRRRRSDSPSGDTTWSDITSTVTAG